MLPSVRLSFQTPDTLNKQYWTKVCIVRETVVQRRSGTSKCVACVVIYSLLYQRLHVINNWLTNRVKKGQFKNILTIFIVTLQGHRLGCKTSRALAPESVASVTFKSNLITAYSFKRTASTECTTNLNILIFSWHKPKIGTVFPVWKRASLSSLHCCVCVLRAVTPECPHHSPRRKREAKIYIFTKENDKNSSN